MPRYMTIALAGLGFAAAGFFLYFFLAADAESDLDGPSATQPATTAASTPAPLEGTDPSSTTETPASTPSGSPAGGLITITGLPQAVAYSGIHTGYADFANVSTAPGGGFEQPGTCTMPKAGEISVITVRIVSDFTELAGGWQRALAEWLLRRDVDRDDAALIEKLSRTPDPTDEIEALEDTEVPEMIRQSIVTTTVTLTLNRVNDRALASAESVIVFPEGFGSTAGLGSQQVLFGYTLRLDGVEAVEGNTATVGGRFAESVRRAAAIDAAEGAGIQDTFDGQIQLTCLGEEDPAHYVEAVIGSTAYRFTSQKGTCVMGDDFVEIDFQTDDDHRVLASSNGEDTALGFLLSNGESIDIFFDVTGVDADWVYADGVGSVMNAAAYYRVDAGDGVALPSASVTIHC